MNNVYTIYAVDPLSSNNPCIETTNQEIVLFFFSF